MAYYRLYIFNGTGGIARAMQLDCSDDASAVAESQNHIGKYGVELWQHARLVARIPANDGTSETPFDVER